MFHNIICFYGVVPLQIIVFRFIFIAECLAKNNNNKKKIPSENTPQKAVVSVYCNVRLPRPGEMYNVISNDLKYIHK